MKVVLTEEEIRASLINAVSGKLSHIFSIDRSAGGIVVMQDDVSIDFDTIEFHVYLGES